MNTVEQREVSIPLGVVVEKKKSTHPWGDWIWTPTAVFMNADVDAKWQVMISEPERTVYHAATLLMTLHRKETEALRLNLMLPEPEIYVVLQGNPVLASPFPYLPHIVTASSYDAQDFHDAGDAIIAKVAMPEPLCALVQAFVEQHHVDEEFIKRRRDRLRPEDRKFGKHPIFSDPAKH